MTYNRIFATTCIAGLAAALAVGCATSNTQDESKMLKPTITYEDIDSGPPPADAGAMAASGAQDAGGAMQAAAPAAPADPFDKCFAKQLQPGIATIDCGTTDAMIAQVKGKIDLDQNFTAYAQNFPKDAKQERYTRQFGKEEAQAIRITGTSFVASMLILPHGKKHTRMVACRVQQTTDWTRCHAITEQLAIEGIPPTVQGSDQLPRYIVARPKPSVIESVTGADGGATEPTPAPTK